MCGWTAAPSRPKASARRIARRRSASPPCAVARKQGSYRWKPENAGNSPPRLYDLTALQRDANRLLGYTAQQTLDYAQSLYEKQLLTYPRTDSRYLPQGMTEKARELAAYAAAALPFAAGFPCPVIPGSLPERSATTTPCFPRRLSGITRWTPCPPAKGACWRWWRRACSVPPGRRA